MKANETLLSALGEVNEKWLPDMAAKKKQPSLRRWAAAGGGICAAVLIGFLLFKPLISGLNSAAGPSAEEKTSGAGCESAPADLPKITAKLSFGGMGFEGLLEYTADELENGNPWREIPADRREMPVYENLLYTDRPEEGSDWYKTEEEMTRAAEEAAASLGMEIRSIEVQTSRNSKDGTGEEIADLLTAACGSKEGTATIRVSHHGTTVVDFDAPLPLSSSGSGTEAAVLEAAERYADFLGFEKAAAAVSRDYGYDSEKGAAYAIEWDNVYEDADDPVQKLLNYSLAYARFLTETGEDGSCSVYAISKGPGMSGIRYVGDYPICSEDEARDMLLRGEYLTSVPADLLEGGAVTEDRIDRAELIYRNSAGEEYVQPYYRFCVRLKEGFAAAETAGLGTWGVFYVPAVRVEYLVELPVWDGRFN